MGAKIPVTFMDTGEEQWITAYPVGGLPLSAPSDHPNFATLCALLVPPAAPTMDEIEEITDLFNPAVKIAKKFLRLSERFAFDHGKVLLDGDPVDQDAPLAKQILRFIEEDVDDWQPLVNFFEKLLTNPNEHSQKMLYAWVAAQNISITPEGDMICYKGVAHSTRSGEDLELFPVSAYPYQATSSGFAIVDGKSYTGYTPNGVGATVEMPRSRVTHNPNRSCDAGLHIGSPRYAQGFGVTRLTVIVNPRDVVSVPNDGRGEKARVCRYRTAEVTGETPIPTAVHDFTPEPPAEEPESYEVSADEVKVPATGEYKVMSEVQIHEEAKSQEEIREAYDESTVLRDHPEVDVYVSPDEDEFESMVGRARRRRRNFVKYATKHGPWTLMQGDGNHHYDWAK